MSLVDTKWKCISYLNSFWEIIKRYSSNVRDCTKEVDFGRLKDIEEDFFIIYYFFMLYLDVYKNGFG